MHILVLVGFGGSSSAFISHMAAMAKGLDEAVINLRLRWAWAGLGDKKQQEMLQSPKWGPHGWSLPPLAPVPMEGFPWSYSGVLQFLYSVPQVQCFTAFAPARPPVPMGVRVDIGLPVIRTLFHLVDTLFGCCCCYGNSMTVRQVQEVAASINKLLQNRLVF